MVFVFHNYSISYATLTWTRILLSPISIGVDSDLIVFYEHFFVNSGYSFSEHSGQIL